jgi:hypothetical protein
LLKEVSILLFLAPVQVFAFDAPAPFSSLQAKDGSPVLLQGDKDKVKGDHRDEEKINPLFVAGTAHS